MRASKWQRQDAKAGDQGRHDTANRVKQLLRRRTGVAALPLILDVGCCGVSATEIGAPRYGFGGFAGSAHDLDPGQSNVLVVAGRVNALLEPVVRTLYEQLAAPRWVVAFGTCAVSGEIFSTIPVARIVPVDAFVPGCPPHTDALWKVLSGLGGREEP